MQLMKSLRPQGRARHLAVPVDGFLRVLARTDLYACAVTGALLLVTVVAVARIRCMFAPSENASINSLLAIALRECRFSPGAASALLDRARPSGTTQLMASSATTSSAVASSSWTAGQLRDVSTSPSPARSTGVIQTHSHSPSRRSQMAPGIESSSPGMEQASAALSQSHSPSALPSLSESSPVRSDISIKPAASGSTHTHTHTHTSAAASTATTTATSPGASGSRSLIASMPASAPPSASVSVSASSITTSAGPSASSATATNAGPASSTLTASLTGTVTRTCTSSATRSGSGTSSVPVAAASATASATATASSSASLNLSCDCSRLYSVVCNQTDIGEAVVFWDPPCISGTMKLGATVLSNNAMSPAILNGLSPGTYVWSLWGASCELWKCTTVIV